MRTFKRQLKVIYGHIEWSTASMFVGLGSLAVALLSNRWPWYVLLFTVLAMLALAVAAARGSFLQKSIDRIAQYERDFNHLKPERRKAAAFLLKREGRATDVDEVLDFFDSPIGVLVDRRYLDEKLVYDFFFEWIRGYWCACRTYVESQTDKTKWSNFKVLYGVVTEIHCSEPDSDEVVVLDGEGLREFLEGELELGENTE